MILLQEEVREILAEVGFRKRGSKIASAIAMCEAPAFIGGKPGSDFGAIGDIELANDVWGYSYGGFQVRSLRADKGTGRTRDEDQLLDSKFNCRSALAIRQSQGWNAWSTYASGMYKAYMGYPPVEGKYTVMYGDTLSKIGDKVGISWQEIARLNNIHAPYNIYIGQVLTLPPNTTMDKDTIIL